MKRNMISVLVIISVALFSCSQQQSKETRGNETVIGVSEEDIEMNRIIEKSRKTIDVFLKAIQDPSIDKYEASVKYPFDTDPGSENNIEHIWVTNISFEDNKYYGIVANDPFYIKTMKLGDKVQIDINKISDWKYLKDGYLIGGKSIKYFYDRMSDEEKKDFDKQSGYKFKE